MTMRSFAALSLPLLSLGTAATAQNTIISPVQAATVEGNSNNAFPWNSATVRRYTQIHSDIGGAPLQINKLSWRQNAGNTTLYTGTWACDLEMFMGDSLDWDKAGWVFASNYVGPRSQVFARRVINLGPLGQNAATGPLPFTVHVPLDAPHTYTGVRSLCWEAVVYSNVLTGSFNQLDTESTTGASGTSAITGTGCTATGRTTAMTHTATGTDRGGPLLFSATVSNAPASAPTALAIGATNPNVAVPGLCANLFTDLAIILNLGTSSAAGAITGDSGFGPVFSPNNFGGATLYTQAFSIDTGRTDPIQVSMSNGRSLVLPFPNLTNVVKVSRIYNSVGGTTATIAGVITSAQGNGLVTQFTY